MSTVGARQLVRQHWPKETDFSKWLAEHENLHHLSEALGLPMRCVAQEFAVGRFRGDLFCEVRASKDSVIIENQLEKGDHSHLGQLMTYGGQGKANHFVWIATDFDQEHLDGVRKLNDSAWPGRAHFAVQLIGVSWNGVSLIPEFKVLVQPEKWGMWRKLDTSQRERKFAEFYHEYWGALRLSDPTHPVVSTMLDHSDGHTTVFGCFNTQARLGSSIKPTYLTTYFLFDEDRRKLHFLRVREHKSRINSKIRERIEPNVEIEWREKDANWASSIEIYYRQVDAWDRNDWARQHELIRGSLRVLKDVMHEHA